MIAYCSNNPIKYADPRGYFLGAFWNNLTETLEESVNYFASAAGVAIIDSPAPGPMDVAAGIFAVGVFGFCVADAFYNSIAEEFTIATPSFRTNVKTGADEAERDTVYPDTNRKVYIYRFGYEGVGAEKMVPTDTDVFTNSGLSFSIKYRKGSYCTTIEALRKTGLFTVEIKGSHVGVFPIGGTLRDWHNQGVESKWT